MKRDHYSEITARILSELEAGAAPWVKPWSAMPGDHHPFNAATGRPYSGCNVVLLWMATQSAGWPTMRFLTFKQALDLGGNVRKGETGTRVVFVKQLTVRDRTKPSTDDEATRTVGMLREFVVFNIAQCENLPARVTAPAATKAPRHSDARDQLADDFMTATRADIREGAGEAMFVPSRDYISLPAFAAFKAADHFYCTAFHELGHWTGHADRLARGDLMRGRFGDNAYAAEELVAELCAAFLCAEFSFDGDLRHAGYIGHWIKLLKADPRAFMTAASKAQAAADYLRGLALADAPADLAEAA